MVRAGFQPRNTPAERRAFFDLERKLGETLSSEDAAATYTTKAYVDAQNTADRAYVDGKFTVATTVAPATGWQHYGGSYGSVRVTRSGNIVNIIGLMQATAATTTSTMGTVPSGFRPIQQILLGQLTSTNALCRVDITMAGAVVLNAIPAVSIPINGWVQLNGSWPIA